MSRQVHSVAVLALILLLALVTACSAGRRRPDSTRDSGMPGADGSTADMCAPGGPDIVCSGAQELTCNSDGTVASMRDCSAEGMVCAAEVGCAVCQPGRGGCDGNQTRVCNDDGSGWTNGEVCDSAAGLSCDASTGHCTSLCADAEASNSYIGCEYWPTPVLNSNVADAHEFAVVVANPQAVPADVTVTRGGSMVATRSIPAGALDTIRLPWVPQLKGTTGSEASALVTGGAYRLRSTVPVTVYQFNALDYRISGDCGASDPDPFDGQCFSYTNDASLLLPTHVLTGNYMVLARAAQLFEIDQGFGGQQSGSPGYFTVIGVEETPVEVQLNLRGHVQPGSGVPDMAAGSTGSFTLNQGDVLQVVSKVPTTCTGGDTETPTPGVTVTYCGVSEDYDLTGTEVRASGRVAVISGHNCAFVPYNRWACDHLEEAMFPLESLGKDYLVGATQPLRGEPNLIRIVSGHDGNMLTFDPAGAATNTTLNRGQMIEFEAGEDFRVTGSQAFMVAQFLVGQDYAGYGSSGEMGQGDPAFSLAIPSEQFRSSYTFLAPNTYEVSYLNVTAPTGQAVMLDGAPVSGWRDVGGTGMATARVMVPGGAHDVTSTGPFGIVVYGFGSYTSYMYPGGLDFEEINVPF